MTISSRSFWCFVVVLLVSSSCTPTVHMSSGAIQSTVSNDRDEPVLTPRQNASDVEELAALWRTRTQNTTLSDYPIGPGDLLEISVPDMEELTNRTVRVSAEGTFELPFIRVIQAAGLSEAALRQEIRDKLERYMHGPEVNLLVREYRSRQVAVIGAVEKPGPYSLAGRNDSLLDMISLAGGMTPDAAQSILLIPSESVDRGQSDPLAFVSSAQTATDQTPELFLRNANVAPLMIDLRRVNKGGKQRYLNLPARPGDVIMIPNAGEVLVQGWVEKPGSYKITSGLTVLGAVAAAGGALYPADTSTVKVIRTGRGGEKEFFIADLEKVKRGEAPDSPVQESDIVEVSSSASKLVPYGFYRFLSTVVNIGANAPLF